MVSSTALSDTEIRERLNALPGWRFEEKALVRVCDSPTYLTALALVQRIGLLAEALDHHPDLLLHYKTLTVRYWTHTAGGVTDRDFEAARQVENLLEEVLGHGNPRPENPR